jgi:hypothetical protein
MTKKALIFIFLAFGFLLGCGGSNQDTDAGNRKGKSRLSFDVQKSDVEPMKHFYPPSSPEATSPAPQGRTEQGH